ncbi:hypothetical protein BDZ89DRAFT_1137283 [Hymenopellis radicata]|nr:hypothetical protein BDZ89DRAFT_1137283 [Hymenopellis radicata]
MSTPAYALFLPLHPKSPELGTFLQAGRALAVEEPDTLQWFALKYKAADTYAIFDTFPTTSARVAHTSGKIPEALMARADELITQPPDLAGAEATVLASKVQAFGSLKCGLYVKIKDTGEDLKQFLINALPLVEAEGFTPVWYAIQFPGYFAIVDFFADEEGKGAHLKGKVAEALMARGHDLEIEELEVLASK